VLVGDGFIPSKACLADLDRVAKTYGAQCHTIDWQTKDLEELNRRNIHIEKEGPAAESPPEELWSLICDADVLIVHLCPVSESLLASAPRLRVLGTMRTGLSNVDIEAAKRRGIEIINLPGRLADSVSEFTIGLMIAETRNIARSHELIRQKRWVKQYSNSDFCFELSGKTIGIIGFGSIGKKMAFKLKNFDVSLLGCDPFVSENTMLELGVEKTDLHTIMSESDIVTLHVELNNSTKGMIGRDEIALMKSTAYIINTSRAAIIEKEALLTALTKKMIAGAALDVFWEEPVDMEDALLRLDNVTVTSHLAGSTHCALLKSFSTLNSKLEPYYIELKKNERLS
jgi:D-3-phosphoglycerate dehydrogenase